jgi:type I restriction enzyme S subunit
MMIKLKKYLAYKNSGVEWLGDIPEGWESLKIKNICVFDKGFGLSKNDITKDGKNECILYGELFTIFKNQNSILKPQSRTNLTIGKTSFGNEVLIPSSTTTSGIDLANAKFFEKKGVLLGGDIIILKSRNNNKYLPKFLSYFLTYASKTEFIKYSKGVTIVHIYAKTIREMPIFLPTIDEQKNIIIYLDKKVQLTDKAIKQKEQLIKLLKERRQILINDAVTKGIDKTVSMKNSGVEWIGDIPEHWKVKKLKLAFNFNKGLTITKKNLIDKGVKCVNYGEIHSKYGFEINPKIHNLKCVDTKYLKSDKKSLLNYGDFIYADTSEDIEGSGNFTYLNSNIKTFAGYHTVICRSKIEINFRFFAYEFDSSVFRYQIQRKVKGVKVYSITQGMLKGISMWLPPLSEQQELVKFLDNQTSKIDKAIDLQQQQITKLKEYKITLIDNVVTGKVRVV